MKLHNLIYHIKMIPKLTLNIFQTKVYYSIRQKNILSPDSKKKSKLRAFHPWKQYKATSEVFDLALIELRQGFQLSKQVSLNILDRIDLPNKKFLIDTPSTSLGNYNISINH